MRILLSSLAVLLAVGAPSAAWSAQKAIKGTAAQKLLKGVKNGTVVDLTSWDCKAVGGTVVVVTDSRCGASKRYCRMPDTNAVCIEEKAN
jgi:hypothetical protein